MVNTSTAEIVVKGNLKIIVPDSLNLITPFVLREQEDWFETEMDFVRDILEPGMKVLDIGANYGLYTTAMAKAIGASGKLTAFEPSRDTAEYLRKTVSENCLSQVEIIQAGVSSDYGEALLSLNDNAELNSINHENKDGECEKIKLMPLDGIIDEYGYTSLDFMKLDAEGEELRIIQSGNKTLRRFSPLIMYELKHGDNYNTPLISSLREVGYKSYYLIPGLNILAPFDETQNMDGYLLNLFACKDDLAEVLENRGWLCRELETGLKQQNVSVAEEGFWASKKYATVLDSVWKKSYLEQGIEYRAEYDKIIDDYIVAHELDNRPAAKIGRLITCYSALKEICGIVPSLPRLLTLARIAGELGERSYAVGILKILLDLFKGSENLSLNERFLAVLPRYDVLDPADVIGEWCVSSILEAKIIYERFSSYYDVEMQSLEELEVLKSLKFQSVEMERRRQLLLLRRNILHFPEDHPKLFLYSEYNLNCHWWCDNRKAGQR